MYLPPLVRMAPPNPWGRTGWAAHSLSSGATSTSSDQTLVRRLRRPGVPSWLRGSSLTSPTLLQILGRRTLPGQPANRLVGHIVGVAGAPADRLPRGGRRRGRTGTARTC